MKYVLPNEEPAVAVRRFAESALKGLELDPTWENLDDVCEDLGKAGHVAENMRELA